MHNIVTSIVLLHNEHSECARASDANDGAGVSGILKYSEMEIC